MEHSTSLDEKLRRIHLEAPMRSEDIDWSLNNPELLGVTMGRTFRNFQRVEQEVDDTVLESLLPNLSQQQLDFVRVWKAQENPHGELFAELRRRTGEQPEDFSNVEIPRLNRLAGALGRVSVGIHEVFEMIYLSRGAMHERLTKKGYELMSDRLTDLGELAIRDTMVKPILKQEAHHLGYYIAAAKQHAAGLKPWQMYAARRLSVSTYAPVGAGAKKDKPDFGHTALTLVSGPPTESEKAELDLKGYGISALPELRLRAFSDPIMRIGQQLLHLGEKDVLSDFVYKGIRECLDAAETEELANAV